MSTEFNLVEYINTDELSDLDPLIKMAVIHYQFESIHPFYDGNGRKVTHQKEIGSKQHEKQQRRLRQEIFDVEDEIEARRDSLIDALEQQMHQHSSSHPLFRVRWQLA